MGEQGITRKMYLYFVFFVVLLQQLPRTKNIIECNVDETSFENKENQSNVISSTLHSMRFLSSKNLSSNFTHLLPRNVGYDIVNIVLYFT